MSIPAIGTQNYNPASLFQSRTDWSSGVTDPRLDSPARPASSTKAAANEAVTVELSDQAKAALAASPPAIEIPKSLDEIIEKRSEVLAAKLTRALHGLGIPPDEEVLFRIDSTGKIGTDSPYKKKIEEFFEKDPEAAQEMKEIASLSALKAAQVALELYVAEKKAARNEDEEKAALGRHMSLSLTIPKLSDVLTFKDGKISSAALDYVNALKPPDAESSDPASRDAIESA